MPAVIATSAHPETGTNSIQQWFDISDNDKDIVSSLERVSEDLGDTLIESFYDHILSHDDAARHFRDEDHISRVKRGQKRYFADLITADLDDAYIQDRLRIGQIHERAGVSPTLYIGAYSHYLRHLGSHIQHEFQDDPGRAFETVFSLLKLAHFDMALALETFVEAREETIQAREREISELPTPVLKLRDGLLLIPVVGTLDSFRARELTIQLLDGIRDHRARAIVLDITGVSAVDSAVANHLIQSMSAARLMGAQSVLTGLSAEVAQSLVKVGVTGEALNTAGDLQGGIELATSLMGQ